MESMKEALSAEFEKAVSDIRDLAQNSEEKLEGISRFVEMQQQLKAMEKHNATETKCTAIQRDLDALRAKVEFIKTHAKTSSRGDPSMDSPVR